MANKLYNDLTGTIMCLYKKLEYFQNRIERENSIDRVNELTTRLEQTRTKYNKYVDLLKKYISFIPGERTRECMELMYIEHWTNEDISDYYCIDTSVVIRELVCGRQIITALDKYNKENQK